jgi:hypothetical protein
MINTAELCRGINGPRLQHCQRTLTKYFVRPVISGLFQRMSKTRKLSTNVVLRMHIFRRADRTHIGMSAHSRSTAIAIGIYGE